MTFTDEAPSEYKGLPNITEIYQGGPIEIHEKMNYFVGLEDELMLCLVTTSVSSNLVLMNYNETSDKYIMSFNATPELKEPFSLNLTVISMSGGSYSLSTHVLSVIACPQSD